MSDPTMALIDDIYADINASPGADGAANSCDEEDDSDLDEPKVLPQRVLPQTPTVQAASGLYKPSPYMTPAPGRLPHMRTPVNRTPLVATTPGLGGRVVYSVSKATGSANVKYFLIQWRKPQQKKHKTWDGDAYLKIEGGKVTMISEEGKQMATTALVGGLPGAGSEIRIGQLDTEVDREVSFDEFNKATSCLNNPVNAPSEVLQARTSLPAAKPFKALVMKPRALGITRTNSPTVGGVRPVSPAIRATGPASPEVTIKQENGTALPNSRVVGPGAFYGPSVGRKIVIGEKNSKDREAWGGALHDPKAPDALVMKRPPEKEAQRRGTTIVDVVIDPNLSKKMRKHQREGVEFMYRCVMGMTGANGQGCILADEMGLGKTLQTIALIYTLCKQSPYRNETSTINRALVVVPVSLVKNWQKEFRKWLPRDFGVEVVENADMGKISNFTHNRQKHVLIIGYERLRKVIKTLVSCQPPIGLIVCDEGHRLKSKDNKTTKMFDVLSTPRRIILSGTPLQNDLGEYWAMANFACPGVFGTYPQFNRQFEKPIMKARTQKCSSADTEKGNECSALLRELSDEFVLRRTAEVLDAYLPPKTEYVLFIAPTRLQLDVVSKILGGGRGNALLGMKSAHLPTMHLLRKVSNSPMLLRKKDEDDFGDEEISSTIQDAISMLGPSNRSKDVALSGKLKVLERIMVSVRQAGDEKMVIVSSFTSTLDVIQDVCIKHRYNFLRLDGSTPPNQRQGLVDRFNTGSYSDSMVFLLSAKAGGVGINLIGACRLVLFDSDWNPSTDLQAMARIHRDGQKQQVYIYRLLTTNTIDEKIYQRQITKTALSEQMMGQGGNGKVKDLKDSFSHEELRDIFSLNIYTDSCQTHDLLGCECEGIRHADSESEATTPTDPSRTASIESSDDEAANIGFVSATQFDPEPTPKMRRKAEEAQQSKLAALKEWRHLDAFSADSFRSVDDNLLYNLVREDHKAFGATTTTTSTSTSTSRSESPDDALPPSKKRKGVQDVIDDTLEETKDILDSASEDSDDEVIVPSRRRRPATKPRILATEAEKKLSLMTLADSGQDGRIMYVFEKISKSRL